MLNTIVPLMSPKKASYQRGISWFEKHTLPWKPPSRTQFFVLVKSLLYWTRAVLTDNPSFREDYKIKAIYQFYVRHHDTYQIQFGLK